MNQSNLSLGAWFHGHLWTIGPHLRHTLQPPQLNEGHVVHFAVSDAQRGAVPASGFFHKAGAQNDHLVIIIHGLASNPDAAYVKAMGKVLLALGADIFRLSLRGATGLGDDHYHGGKPMNYMLF